MGKVFRAMAQQETAGGVLLIAASILALIFANSYLSGFYNGVLNLPLVVAIGAFEISKPLLLWVNDGLMALFFLMVGLEVKREVLEGHLSQPSQVVLPGLAALAGVAFPARIYASFNWQDPTALRGWAIPSATDIAFAVGVFSLFGRHLPVSLKLFLLSVAIFDDIAAIVIIALFYSHELSTLSLLVAGIGIVILFVLNRLKIRHVSPFMFVGLVVWAAVLKSGVHATLAGFVIAWFIPLKHKNIHDEPMLLSLEHALQPWVAYFILPFFAFVNAGVHLGGIGLDTLTAPVTLGIIVGLFVGKQLGIFSVCWLSIKLRIAKLPEGATWRELYGVCLLAGIGFTMSLFIGSLAFEGANSEMVASVKLGVLFGSLLSAICGALILTNSRKIK